MSRKKFLIYVNLLLLCISLLIINPFPFLTSLKENSLRIRGDGAIEKAKGWTEPLLWDPAQPIEIFVYLKINRSLPHDSWLKISGNDDTLPSADSQVQWDLSKLDSEHTYKTQRISLNSACFQNYSSWFDPVEFNVEIWTKEKASIRAISGLSCGSKIANFVISVISVISLTLMTLLPKSLQDIVDIVKRIIK